MNVRRVEILRLVHIVINIFYHIGLQAFRHQEVDQAVVTIVIKDSQLLSIVEDEEFRELIHMLELSFCQQKGMLSTIHRTLYCVKEFSPKQENWSQRQKGFGPKTLQKHLLLNKNL